MKILVTVLVLFLYENVFCGIITKTTTTTVTITDKYEEIKNEHFMIYNDEKHLMKLDEFQKDGYAQKALNLAILKYNDGINKMKMFSKFDKILNGSFVKPIEIKIYSFKVQLVETKCEYNEEFRMKLVKERQVNNSIIDNCISTNINHQCKFDVTVSTWEKYDAKKYKFNRLFCD
jgi:hypothetical protein